MFLSSLYLLGPVCRTIPARKRSPSSSCSQRKCLASSRVGAELALTSMPTTLRGVIDRLVLADTGGVESVRLHVAAQPLGVAPSARGLLQLHVVDLRLPRMPRVDGSPTVINRDEGERCMEPDEGTCLE